MQASIPFRNYAAVVVRHRWCFLTLVASLTLLLAAGALQIHVEVDPDRQLPQDHPYVQTFHRAHHLFGDWNLAVIGLRPTSGKPFTPAFLSKVKLITDRIAEIPGAVLPLLDSVTSPTAKSLTAEEHGLRVTPLMADVPATPAAALSVQERLFDDPSYVGTLVSYDGEVLAIYATFELTSQLPGYVNLYHALLAVLQNANDGSFTYYVSGPIAVVSSLNIYASQVAYFFPVALLVIALVHYDAFRTWQAVALPLLTGLLAVVWSLGLMGYLAIPLDPFNSTTPVLILAVGAGHAVQILKRYYEEFDRSGDNYSAIVESTARVGGVMIAAGTIAALSFFSLATIGTESMRTFGIFTGLGILSALAIEMTMIPALRAVLSPPCRQDWEADTDIHPWLDHLLQHIARKLSSPFAAGAVLLAYVGTVAISMILATRIEVDTSFKRDFSPSDQIRVDDDVLNSLFAGTNSLIFMIEGPEEGAIAEPAALRGMDGFERELETLRGVGKAFSVVDTLKRLHRALNPNEPGELPDSRDLATQYLFLYSLSGGDDLATRVTPDNRIAKIVVMLHEDSTNYGEQIIASARKLATKHLPPGYTLHVAGSLASNSALAETMVRGKVLNVLQIGIITVVVAAIVLHSLLGGFLVAIPLAIAVLINFGAMGLFNVRLDITTAAITAMAVGIGADYAVYFVFRLREEYCVDGDFEAALSRSLRTSGKAVLFVSTAVALGYSVLCLSNFSLFVQLGSLVGLAMVTSSLATLLVLPALLSLISRTDLICKVLGGPRTSGFADTHVAKRPASNP